MTVGGTIKRFCSVAASLAAAVSALSSSVERIPLEASVVSLAFLMLFSSASLSAWPESTKQVDWQTYNGGVSGDHFSRLSQINRRNVHLLKKVWVFDLHQKGGLQTNPLIIGGVLYGYDTQQTVIALNAVTGEKLWSFRPPEPSQQPARGLSYWTDGKSKILFAGMVSYLYALDPATGRPIPTFGDHGRIDLRQGLADPGQNYTQSFAALTTPGLIYRDLIIVGSRLPESEPALRGDVRAFDVHDGSLKWTFHTIPHPGEPGYETWMPTSWKTSGSANNWAGMTLDEKREILYVPTGSAVNDFYGADRIGDDLYADCLLALDANTGKMLWHFQEVHHDIWDRDLPAPPALLTVRWHGKVVDAVAQTTKQGFVYVFNRVTGEPLFPVEERSYPASNVPGERTSRTEPLPLAPEPFARQRLTEEMLTTRTPQAHAYAEAQFKTFISGGQFIPLSVNQQTVVFPGFDGGAEWGGPAVDTRAGVLYVNANDVAWTGGLTENKPQESLGASIYQSQCAVCHGADLKGSPPAFPSLIGVRERVPEATIRQTLHEGKGRMPSFPSITGDREVALLDFLRRPDEKTISPVERNAGLSPNRAELHGAEVYAKNCAMCHGDDLLGGPAKFPSLVGVRRRMGDKFILATVHDGRGRMPAFAHLSDYDAQSLLRFLGSGQATQVEGAIEAGHSGNKKEVEATMEAAGPGSRYQFTGYRKFLDQDGYPAIQPPWGTLSAIDLHTGKYLWKIPFGYYPELAAAGMADTGTENYGGPILTAGGLLFIGATNFDRKIRAFDSRSGKLLWSGSLPYSGNATPATYMVDGKQYVVIATSGARDTRGPQGAAYVAFALSQ